MYINIKNVLIEKTTALAPMAGVSDFSFRYMAKRFGASYAVGEMASAKGLCFNDKKTAALLSVTEYERPMAIQLFGNEPEYISRAVKIAEQYNPDIIDINAGCPVPKVAGNGSGAALMKSPKLLGKVISAAVNSTGIPVTVKIRSGWDKDSINAVETAKIAESCGAAAVTVHARTRDMFYSGKADWSIIKNVKDNVNIPVVGNGDVTDAESCAAMYRETGCDLVMIGRGAYGKPWIFKEIKHYLETNNVPPPPDLTERIEIMKEHIEHLIIYKGEHTGMKEARKYTGWYLKGLKNAAQYRNICCNLSTADDLYKLIDRVRNENL